MHLGHVHCLVNVGHRSIQENNADTWAPVQDWAIRQRMAERSVLFLHHGGKTGTQRGTSKKEDVLDTVIKLCRPADYIASRSARFEVHFTKSRGIFGEDVAPFEAWLQKGRIMGDIGCAAGDESLRGLKAQGLSFRQIFERTGLPPTTVHRKGVPPVGTVERQYYR